MAAEKIPLMQEKTFSYKGLFNLSETYKFVKDYLESGRFFDVGEIEIEEKNEDGKRELMSKLSAEQEYTDYFKIYLVFEINMGGVDVIVEDKAGRTQTMTKGHAKIIVNAFLITDYMEKRTKSPLMDYLNKVYDKFIGHDEIGQAKAATAKEVAGLIGNFKKALDSTLK